MSGTEKMNPFYKNRYRDANIYYNYDESVIEKCLVAVIARQLLHCEVQRQRNN